MTDDLSVLSQVAFVLDDMSQKGAICTKIYGRFVTIFFSTLTICHHFIFKDGTPRSRNQGWWTEEVAKVGEKQEA